MKRSFVHIFSLLAFLIPAIALADDVKTVSAEFTYYGSGELSRDECKRRALEGARIEALGQKFGLVVENVTYTNVQLTSKGESQFFDQRGTTLTKGEWINDIGEPTYDISIDAQGNYIVKCTVKGKARPISNEASDFEFETLKNTSERKHFSTEFTQGDQLYIYFRAPADGYMTAYLIDKDNIAWNILPYAGSTDQVVKVKKNKEYYFCDPTKDETNRSIVDEYVMTTDESLERNDIYVLFSTNPFNKALDRKIDDNLPSMVEYKAFADWLGKVRRSDKKMGLKLIPITITNPNANNY